MIYLRVKLVQLIQSAGALCAVGVFTAGLGHCVVVAGKPGGVGPACVISDTTALKLHRDKERTDKSLHRIPEHVQKKSCDSQEEKRNDKDHIINHKW